VRAHRHFRVGAWLVAAYVAAAIATTTWSPGAVRPLFDGFGSHPGQYYWVEPPKEFAEGNQKPEAAQAGIVLEGPDGSGPASASPPDGQVLVTVVPKAVPPRPPDEAATVDARPVDAATLAPLPAGLRAEGNAYRIAVTYRPSGTVLDKLSEPGVVGLTSAAPADILLFSPDGKAWQRRDATPLQQGLGLTGVFDEVGYYLAAAEGPPREAASGGGVPVVVFILGALVPLALAGLLLGRRSRPATSGKGRRPAAARAPGGAKKAPARRPPGGKRPKRPPPKRR
jgi:hypothetical protein